MNWDQKVEMITLANQANDEESRKKFIKFVADNISTFDAQAYDMFITAFNLVPDEMKSDIEQHKIIYPSIKNLDLSSTEYSKIGTRAGMRLGYYLVICDEDLQFNQNEQDDKNS